MKIKNNSVILGLMLALSNLGAVKAQAAQLDSRVQCQPFTIQISILEGYYSNGTNNLETRLNDEAAKRCYGHRFIIDRSSIERQQVQLPGTGFDPKYAVAVFATVACMNN